MKNRKLPSRLLALALCLCMVLGLMPMMPLVAEAATVPNYISSIGISQDGSSGSTGVNDCKRELDGHTIIDVDLNDEAGGDYVYMGYKTTTDPAQAITGILFRVGKNPPNSISYGGSTFYLVGGSTEANTAELGGYIDLNARAGGYYIYTYVTRDPNYGAPLTNLTVNRSSSYSGWYAGTDTNGNVMDLNDDASNYYLYLHYQRFSGNASSTFYYLTSGGSRTSSTTSVSVKNHTQSVSTAPSVPSTVTYDGRTFTFRGWREDNTASSSTVSPSYTYMTSKTYRAVYSATVALSYNANGGSGAPSSQTATQYINAGSSSVSKTSHSFTISATKPTHDDSKCVFLGWSTGSSAISASHQPSQTITISSNTTLYAVWRGEHTANRTYVNNGANHTYTWPCCGKSVTEAHSYTDGFCVCGAMIPDAVATVSKNGKVVAAYTILNDAIQAVRDCTAADEAVITILKGIALGDNYQTISSGVFTIDLNGFEISSTSSNYGALYVYGATVTIRDSGEDGKITGKHAGIEVFEGELTVLDGTVIGGSSRDNYGVYASGSSTVTISGGSFSGYYGVYAAGSSTVTISGGTISGESAGVYADRSNVNISNGSISSDTCGVDASNKSTVKISGGTVSSHDYGMFAYYSTVTVSDGSVSGDFRGVDAYSSTVTISGGSVSGDASGVYAYNASTVTISGGTVSGNDFGVDAYVSSTVTISGGTVSGVSCGVYANNRSTVTISGGSISFGNYGIRNNKSIIALTLGDDGVGATFRGGITVLDTTLNEILGEGAAYWQGDTMILPADGATVITGGDVVIKSTCPHASKSNYTDLKDGASHTYFCSGCNNTFTESHSYTNGLCACGAMISDAVASVSKNGIVTGAYTTLNDAIQAVRNCTAADKAVVTILQDIALGDSQKISSGVFTIDLNSKTLSGTNSTYGVLYLIGSGVKVTVTDSGTGGTISGYYGVNAAYDGWVTISGGTISGEQSGVVAQDFGTVTITGGTISGEKHGLAAYFGGRVIISGGIISGEKHGVYANDSIVMIKGGSISGDSYDIFNYASTMILTLGENGVGATFPGGIKVYDTTLNEILDEGAAYWQGNTMILPANNATEITDGDVVIKAECKHPGDKTYTNNGNDHSYTYSCCNATVTESHSYSNGLCACGAVSPDAVASVSKNGIVTGAYTTLNDAIQAVADCTADDKAVVTILQDIALGDSYQEISFGVFTIDLNGHEISSTASIFGALYINGADVHVTIQGTGENSKITGDFAGIEMSGAALTVISGTISGSTYGILATYSTVTISGGSFSGDYGVYAIDSTVTISGGTISGNTYGIIATNSTVTISGGTISGVYDGVYAIDSTVTISGGTISGGSEGVYAINSTMTISGGTISGVYDGVYAYNNSTVTISGGSISGGNYDLRNYNSTIALTLGDDGVGATFPGGIRVDETTLNAILGEGAAYWQGNTMILPADGATEITGGDVVIKAVCPHTASKTGYVDLKDGANHTYVCTGCNVTLTEGHTYTDGYCICGAVHPDMVASVSKNGVVTGAYTTLNDAIQAVRNCTADDKAVVTILKDIALGDSNQEISSGVFTIELNGHEISSTKSNYGALYINGADIHVTIQGTGENSKITGNFAGIEMFGATLTVISGTISGSTYGIFATYSTVTISGGTISSVYKDVYASDSTVTISGGSFSGDYGVHATSSSTVTISGGTISGVYEGVSAYNNSTVTISGGTISGENAGVYADGSIVMIRGGTISGDYGVYVIGGSTVTIIDGTISGVNEGMHASNNSTVTISGGTISGDYGVYVINGSTVTIIDGTIIGVNEGVHASNNSTVTINGGTIRSEDDGVKTLRSTLTISGGTISGKNAGVNHAAGTATISGGTISGGAYGIAADRSTITISGGAISDGNIRPIFTGVRIIDSTVTISGGNISTDDLDIYTYNYSSNSIIALTLGEDGVGATFPGGIFVEGTTLNAILGEGAAYWQGDKQINPADDATEITGGDVVIKAACKHSGDKTYTNNGDDHTYTCSICDATVTEGHTYIDGMCVCGVADVNVAVASTTVGGITTYYGTLGSAIQAVKDCTAADKAVVTILKDIALGDNYQTISSGVFTIDLNGHEISSTHNQWGALYLSGTDVNVTVQGAGESSKITGIADDGINVFDNATLTITGGTITGKKQGVYAVGSTVTINGGTISGVDRGVYIGYSTLIISGGTISGRFGVSPVETDLIISGGTISGSLLSVYSEYSTVTISGGIFSTGDRYLYSDDSTITLTLGENGVGARFLGGITVTDATLNEILGEGAAYWQGDKQIIPADNATAIFNGDVVIKAQCKHPGDQIYTNNGDDHTYTCSSCNVTVTEGHTYIDGVCVCGAVDPDIVASVSKNGVVIGVYTTLYDAIQAVANCTADDEAVVTILKNIDLGRSYQRISSGVFTIDLNGHKISNINAIYGTLFLSGSGIDVTITDSGTGGTITSDFAGIELADAELTINGGTISGDQYGVYIYANNTMTISGGSISGGEYDIVNSNSTVALTLGENGVGATFPGGITVYDTTLNAILGEGAAYWQGDKLISPANGATEITGGDVVIKASVAPVYSGWTEIDGDWYYYDPDTGKPVTGIVRVPYPADAINGVTYAPNMEDVKYANDKGTLFKDSISAFFVFDENGVFQSGLNGMTSDNRWAVNGCIVWHVGLVQVGEDYYYFIGDVDNGGNKMATGDVYVSRNTTDFDMVPGGVYTFGEDGKLCMYEGIVDLRYYENYRLMIGNGLTKVGENYIYVNSKGELIVDSEYYIPGNDLGIASGTYTFDENGFMIQPVSTDKDGVYFENGAWYYYVDGTIGYNKGLISVNTTWHGADGSENVYSGYIYVRSSGKLATGEYYITNVSNDASGLFTMGMKVLFDENGIADAPKNGIYEIDGGLYYFVGNQIQYNAGLIEYNGGWIYVRSSGKLAVGDYWITNTNGAMDQGMYEFGTDGYLVITDVEDGIVNDNGVLYYYLDGKKQYGLGLRQLEGGSYIYVRTNGQLATGSYWITNHNGLLPEGLYTFGEDGILTSN